MQTVVIDRYEEAATLRMSGARLREAKLVRGRVSMEFSVSEKHLKDLSSFRAGLGPRGNVAEFFGALVWSKDTIYAVRRSVSAR